MALEEKAVEGCAEEEYVDWIALHTRRERRWFEVLRYLMPGGTLGHDGRHLRRRGQAPASLLAIPRPALARPSHQSGSGDPRACEGYFRQLDGLIAEIVELAGPRRPSSSPPTTASGRPRTSSTSTPGSSSRATSPGAPATAPSAAVPELGFGQIARHVFELDWDRTVAYAATPSSQGIHIVPRSRRWRAHGRRREYLRLRAEIAEGLRGLRHPRPAAPVVAEVWTRDDVFAGPYERLRPT